MARACPCFRTTETNHEMSKATTTQSAPPVGSVVAPRGTRWFYVWWLPTVWVLAAATLWSMTLVESDSHFGIVIALAVWPVLWLVDAFMWSLGSPWVSSNAAAAVATCVFGGGILGAVGCFQDLLRVPRPRRPVVLIFVAVLASFLLIPYVSWLSGSSGVLVVLPVLAPILVLFCNFLLIFSVGSIAVYVLAAVLRAAKER